MSASYLAFKLLTDPDYLLSDSLLEYKPREVPEPDPPHPCGKPGKAVELKQTTKMSTGGVPRISRFDWNNQEHK